GSTPISTGGSYSYTAQASGLGTITAKVIDLWGQQSSAQVKVNPAPPVVSNFQAVEESGPLYYCTFSGVVTDKSQSPAGLWVTLGGLPSLTGKKAEVQSDGTWSITVQLQAGECGTATAQTQDAWGQLSNIAMTSVSLT